MKAISLLQPWASLVAEGLKEFETRSWQTPYKGRIAIHASKKPQPEEWMQEYFIRGVTGTMPHGAIIALATLRRCFLTENVSGISERERLYGDWTPGRWAWALDDVVKLPEPVPCRGSLGLWDVPREQLELMRQAVAS